MTFAMVEGPSTEPHSTHTAQPRAGTDDAATRDDLERIESATNIGRFTILELVGTGGMGQVYAAYDPQLDRKVALKLLHAPDDEVARRRLVREAQALARLNHPNVVAVHEVGAHRDRLFVAMEFVDGQTLRDWARAHPPGDEARLQHAIELVLHAGSGLAAAHAAGLVHRDVKPGNILVGRDGRVRVADFGLARAGDDDGAMGDAAVTETDSELTASRSNDLGLHGPLTLTGMVAGTPAYMAPEQFNGEPVGAASDQFAFCVTAWEVFFGERPFALDGIMSLLEGIRDGRLTRPAAVQIPPALEAALRKGLSYRPKRRHATMDALLDVIQAAARQADGASLRPRATAWTWGGAIALGSAATLFAVRPWHDEGPRCTPPVGAFDGSWDAPRRAAIEAAVRDTGAPFALETWSRLAPVIDRFGEDWSAAHVEACEATHVRGEQSAELLDLRMACLQDRRRSFTAFLDVLADPTADTLAEADDALDALPSIAPCSDAAYVRGNLELPGSADDEARVASLRDRIARATALHGAGRLDAALAEIDAVLPDVTALGRDSELARASFRRGVILADLQQDDDARAELESAYLHARRSGLSEAAAQSSRVLALVTGRGLYRFDEGRWWLRLAALEGERIDDEMESIQLALAGAALSRVEGRLSAAVQEYESAIARLRNEVGEQHIVYARALRSLGELELVRARQEAGCKHTREAFTIASGVLGDQHPSIVPFVLAVANCDRSSGDLQAAKTLETSALAIIEAAYGPDHVALSPVLSSLAETIYAQGDTWGSLALVDRAIGLSKPTALNEATIARLMTGKAQGLSSEQQFVLAEAAFRDAFERSRAALGDHHPQTATARIFLGSALGAIGRESEAMAWIEAGLAIDESILGSEHPDVAVVYDMLAAEMERRGNFQAAEDYARRAHGILEAAYGPTALPLIRSHGNLCGILSARKKTSEAVEHCERALEIAGAVAGYDQTVVASLHNSLGVALVAAGRYEESLAQYDRALELWTQTLRPTDVRISIVEANLGEVRSMMGAHALARDHYRRALSIREAARGTYHPMLVVPLVGAARAESGLGNAAAAVALARRAVALCATAPVGSPLVSGRADEALARALWDTAPGRREATALAQNAARVFQDAGEAGVDDSARIHAWMRARSIEPRREASG